MLPNGSFVVAWTQDDLYTGTGGTSVYQSNTYAQLARSYPTYVASQSIYYRTFTESTDTAGPEVSDVTAPDGTVLEAAKPIHFDTGGLQYIVLDFDEDLLAGNPTTNPDSVLNPANYILSRNGLVLTGGVANVQYGLNKAYQAGLSPLPTNKWEVILTVDGNSTLAGLQPLNTGTYTIQVVSPVAASQQNPNGVSGIRDAAGNPLNSNGRLSNGASFSRQFAVTVGSSADDAAGESSSSGGGGGGSTTSQNGHTYPESAQAVAVAPNGIHIAVWTAYDTVHGKDRVYFRLFDDDGSPADLPLVDSSGNYLLDGSGNPIVITDAAGMMSVTPYAGELGYTSADNSFFSDDQRYATVACDGDGDFVITWTNIRNVNGILDANVYARRFNSTASIKGVYFDQNQVLHTIMDTAAMSQFGDAFMVNTYATNNQQWSRVAMDAKGDFIITWSSYGQEDNNQLGSGWGVYAKRYDSFGNNLGSEFRANITTAGNQQNSSVALSDNGLFIIVWQSDQLGGNNQFDIYGRIYNADGSPGFTALLGEDLLNLTTAGNQILPDVAFGNSDPNIDPNIIVTWQSANQDGSGWGIYMARYGIITYTTPPNFWPYIDLSRAPSSNILDTTTNPPTIVPLYFDVPINATTTGDQMYPSIAMARDGTYVIAWCGIGNQPNQADTSGYGVFYQRFGLYRPGFIGGTETFIGTETRANTSTTGNQWIPSIGLDGSGNVIIVFTGVGATPGSTDVYKFLSGSTQGAVRHHRIDRHRRDAWQPGPAGGKRHRTRHGYRRFAIDCGTGRKLFRPRRRDRRAQRHQSAKLETIFRQQRDSGRGNCRYLRLEP